MTPEQKPAVAILKTDGINCEDELTFAFEQAGGDPREIHLNDLLAGDETLSDYQILALPGGFSYGDNIASGRVLANKIIFPLRDRIHDYINHDGLVIGICNGFQVLARSGLLPFREPVETLADMDMTLGHNDSGHLECRWVDLEVSSESPCVFTSDMQPHVTYQVAHGEGKAILPEPELRTAEAHNLVVFRYLGDGGLPTQEYPQNPNGSVNAIAGLTDPSGRILGLMPHPERYVLPTQHPNWRRRPDTEPHGKQIFRNMVQYAKEM
jgi:phosphoribosylformylglycinamidine synthase subunit PurQ / glutaminase